MKIELIGHANEVVLVFEGEFKWISMPPEAARDLARNMTKLADQLDELKAGAPKGSTRQ